MTNSSISSIIFQVRKIDLVKKEIEYYGHSFSNDPSFLVNTVVSTSATNANDLYFAGKTKKLTVL